MSGRRTAELKTAGVKYRHKLQHTSEQRGGSGGQQLVLHRAAARCTLALPAPLPPLLPLSRGRLAATSAWYCWECAQRSTSRARSTGSGWLSARVCALLQPEPGGEAAEHVHRQHGAMKCTAGSSRHQQAASICTCWTLHSRRRPVIATKPTHRRYQPTGLLVASS